MKFLGKILIASGLLSLIFGFYLTWQRNNPNRIAFTNSEIKAQEVEKLPVKFLISKENINLPIVDSKIINQKWEVTDKGISRIGNIYYGHNWKNILGNLVNVKPGDIIEIQNSDNSTKKYKVEITQEVDPSQKDILNLATDDKILIYTCSGFLDSKRFVVIAKEF